MVVVETKSHEILSSPSVRLNLQRLLPLRRNLLGTLCFSYNQGIIICDLLGHSRQSFLLDCILNAGKIPLDRR